VRADWPTQMCLTLAKHPISLNRNHHIATLVVCNCNERTMHSGVKSTLTEIRSRYWIVKGRQFVRKIIFAVCDVPQTSSEALSTANSTTTAILLSSRVSTFWKYWSGTWLGHCLLRIHLQAQVGRFGFACTLVVPQEPYTLILSLL